MMAREAGWLTGPDPCLPVALASAGWSGCLPSLRDWGCPRCSQVTAALLRPGLRERQYLTGANFPQADPGTAGYCAG